MRYVIVLLMGMMLMGCGKDKPTGPKTVNFTVENGINYDGDTYAMIILQFSSTSSNSWGIDRLGDTILLYGGSVSFEVTSGTYDFKATDIDGDCYYKGNVKVEKGSKVRITANDVDFGCSNGKLVVDDNFIKK